MSIPTDELKTFLDEKVLAYNRPSFLLNDPISIPHQLDKKEDIEIIAFITATIAWGQRTTIIKNAKNLLSLMGEAPHEFIMTIKERDLSDFFEFKHRTFNAEDLIFFFNALNNIYENHGGLEAVFCKNYQSVEQAIEQFRSIFLNTSHSTRSEKHIANPRKGSAAKRINMYLRWMVRNDGNGVDFGIWNGMPSSDLLIPLDVHSGNVARKLGLLKRKQNDWKAVLELTNKLKKFDAKDPIKYDYALFGLGAFEKF